MLHVAPVRFSKRATKSCASDVSSQLRAPVARVKVIQPIDRKLRWSVHSDCFLSQFPIEPSHPSQLLAHRGHFLNRIRIAALSLQNLPRDFIFQGPGLFTRHPNRKRPENKNDFGNKQRTQPYLTQKSRCGSIPRSRLRIAVGMVER